MLLVVMRCVDRCRQSSGTVFAARTGKASFPVTGVSRTPSYVAVQRIFMQKTLECFQKLSQVEVTERGASPTKAVQVLGGCSPGREEKMVRNNQRLSFV
jgi:hypothetical protein